MKRLLSILIVGILLFSLTGCQDEPIVYEPTAVIEFPNLNWGLSIDEVKAAYPQIKDQTTKLTEEKYEVLELSGVTSLLGQKAEVCFGFISVDGNTYLTTATADFYEMDHALLQSFSVEQVEPAIGWEDGLVIPTTADFDEDQLEIYEQNIAYTDHATYPMPMKQVMLQYGISTSGDGENTKQWYRISMIANFWVLGHIPMYPQTE